MNIDALIKALTEVLEQNQAQPVPLNRAVWSARQVAAFLDLTPKYVVGTLRNQPGFPTPKRIPSAKGAGHLRWQATEILKWWEKR